MISMLFWLCCGAILHPFHVSLAQGQWNESGDRVQVALRLTPRDLDTALSEATGERVVLEKLEADRVRALVEGYLAERLYFTAEEPQAKATPEALKGRRAGFHWVGIEQEVRYTWVYFELDCPRIAEVWLVNEIFMEVEPTQINTFQWVKSSPVLSLQTTREEPSRKFALAKTRRPAR